MTMGLRAIMVAVDYTDLLAVTLPYNRHHFEEVCVVTAPEPDPDRAYPLRKLVHDNGCSLYCTDAFYRNGAVFNKWAALEEGLDQMGRHGWLCLMDADVLWPRGLSWSEREWSPEGEAWKGTFKILECHTGANVHAFVGGQLYSPLRRMAPWPLDVPSGHDEGNWCQTLAIAALQGFERGWPQYPVHRNVNEWAGYSQIFHADDPVLGPPPWHETDWRHAGGADSFFQMKWPRERKVRPPFEVLHLGPAGENWCGRATPYADGSMPQEAVERRRMTQEIWAGRRRRGVRHGPNSNVYRDEKLT